MQLQPEATNLADRATDATDGRSVTSRKLSVEFIPEPGGEASVRTTKRGADDDRY
jgi:hypothetical protein